MMDVEELLRTLDAQVPHKDPRYVPPTATPQDEYVPPSLDDIEDITPDDLSFDIDFDMDDLDDTLEDDAPADVPTYIPVEVPTFMGAMDNDLNDEEDEEEENIMEDTTPDKEEQAAADLSNISTDALVEALKKLGVDPALLASQPTESADPVEHVTPTLTVEKEKTSWWKPPRKENKLEKYQRLSQQTTREPIIIGVTSFKGGVGKTTISTTLGILSGKIRGKRSIVIDTDFHGGAAERATGKIIGDIYQASQMLLHSPDLGVQNFITEGDHCDFIAAPSTIQSALVSAEGISRVVNGAIKDGYTFIVLDLPIANMGAWWEKVLSLCTNLIMVSDSTLDSVSRLPEIREWIALNKASSVEDTSTLVVTHSSKEKSAIDVPQWIETAHKDWRMEAIEIPFDKVFHTGRNIEASKISPGTVQQMTVLAAVVVHQKTQKEKHD